MKHLILIVLFLSFAIGLWAQTLIKVDLVGNEGLLACFKHPEMRVHYYNERFLLATAKGNVDIPHQIVCEKTDPTKKQYFILWTKNKTQSIPAGAEVLFSEADFHIVSLGIEKNIFPFTSDAVSCIHLNKSAKLPADRKFENITEANPEIETMVTQVNSTNVWNSIQHLQDYGTRLFSSSQAIQAQNWLKSQFESLGLTVSLQDFPYSPESSDNVVAIQPGAVFPDQFIVVGGHYDSYVFSGSSMPGADDNASGTAGVLEIARVLSQYQFNKSIVYCAFSAEEIGLVGSEAWVEWAVEQNMNIEAYLNLDMIGYLNPGDNIHTDIIAPSSADPLVEFYKQIVQTYVSGFEAFDGTLSGGDSDHTSFNNAGIMGIFPFEDSDDYSPYIHSANDLLETSVNSQLQLEKFTQAGVAFVAELADVFNGMFPPTALQIDNTENANILTWLKPEQEGLTAYNVYRNGVVYHSVQNPDLVSFTDYSISVGNSYSYHITALYEGEITGESYASNSVEITLGLHEIASYDFETGLGNWTIEPASNSWVSGATVELTGNSTQYLSIDSDAAGSGTHVFGYAVSPLLNLNGFNAVSLSFDYGYKFYNNDFLKLMFRVGNKGMWTELADLSPSANFVSYTLDLPQFTFTDGCQIAFYYDDNNTWAWWAAVDNVLLRGVETVVYPPSATNLSAVQQGDQIVLNWQAPSREVTAFKIFRDGVLTGTTQSNVLSWSDASVEDGNLYTYYVVAQHESGESAPSNQVVVAVNFNAIQNNIQVLKPVVYPNPVSGVMNLKFDYNPESVEVIILTTTGTNVFSRHFTQIGKNISIDTKFLSGGVYFLVVKTKNGITTTKFTVID